MSRLMIVALGSSFAAGPNIDPIINKGAARSGQNYAHQLAKELDADLTDLTVSGATLLQVLNENQTSRSGEVFSPQLDSLPSDADIVTLTGGGNDLGYSRGMIYDSILSSSPGPLSWVLKQWMTNPTTEITPEQLTERFLDVIDAIHAKAPQARIYLLQYPALFGQNSQPGPVIPLTPEMIEHYRRRGKILDRSYETAANERSSFVELVPVAKWSEGHEVGTEEPWVDGFTLSMLWKGYIPYHPTLAGHTAVAGKLHGMIKDRQSGPA